MISFFKEKPFQVKLQGQLALIYFAAGFSKSVDPLSGMTVNLNHVNRWLEELQANCQTKDYSDPLEMLAEARDFLKLRALSQEAHVSKVRIRFEDTAELEQNEAGIFLLLRNYWASQIEPAMRTQVRAKFLISKAEDLKRFENLQVAGQFQTSARELFFACPQGPISVEVFNPLTGNSIFA